MEMTKDDNIIGLRLAGGRKKINGGGFIYVQSINKGSIADIEGLIQEHDILLMVKPKKMPNPHIECCFYYRSMVKM